MRLRFIKITSKQEYFELFKRNSIGVKSTYGVYSSGCQESSDIGPVNRHSGDKLGPIIGSSTQDMEVQNPMAYRGKS